MTNSGNRFVPPIVLIIFGLFSIFSSGTAMNPAASASVVETVNVPLQQFAQATAMWQLTHNAGATGRMEIHIPSLEIYDPNGKLVFSGDNADKNAELLRRLPTGLKDLTPVSPGQDIQKVFTIVPALDKKADALTASHRYTLVLATSLANCAGCKRQDDAENEARSKKDLDVNILRIVLEK